jgi:lactoylglutathione lyase
VASRAFPVAYSRDVDLAAKFWELLGFERFVELPAPDGTPGYVGLRRGSAELAVTHHSWAADRYGMELGDGPRFEMYVYVEELEATVERLRDSGVKVIRDPEDMPWGERIATVLDPDSNLVALCADPPNPR